MKSYLQNKKSYQTQSFHQKWFYAYDDSREISFQQSMAIMIFGRRAWRTTKKNWPDRVK